MDYNQLASQSKSPDEIIVGEKPKRKKNTPQDTWNVDEDYAPRTKRHYIGTDHYLDAQAVKWYRDKTGFPLPTEHADYFFTLPFGMAKDLIILPSGKPNLLPYESGIAFCHEDGDIYQYRPHTAVPSWEIQEGEWVPGKPIKYFTVSREKLGADGITPVKIPPKPFFLKRLREYPNSPNVLVITEGFTKAACLSHLGFDAIHLPGVTCWNTPSAQEVLKSHQGKYDFYVLAFDADSQTNPSVKREQLKFCKTYNARVSSWVELSPESKGFDDLCLLVGIDDVKSLRGVILNAKEPDTGYYISNRQTPYPTMFETITEVYPHLFFDGRYWVNEGKRLSKAEVDKMLLAELQKFYTLGKMGKEFIWATKYKECLEYINLHLTRSDVTNVTFLSNGYLTQGEFYPTSVPDPRALPWERLSDYDKPQEFINFLQQNHTNLDYRLWLRSLFDNSIPYGAILGVTGQSGAGKSVTLSVAQLLLGELHCQNSSLMIFETNERIAGLGNPKAIIQSDCQRLPEKMDELFIFTDASPISVRSLYQTGYESRRFFCRVAFGFVNLPYIAGSNEGFARRFKLITCGKYPGMSEDIPKLVNQLKNHDYLNRIFNWVMDAPRDEVVKFMNPIATDGISPELKAQGSYKFIDQTLIPEKPTEEITVREFYEAYQIFCTRQRKRVASYEDFFSTIQKVGVPTIPGINTRLPNGKFITTDDLLDTAVDERIMSIARLGTGSFYGVNTRYFSTRETKENWEKGARSCSKCEIIFNGGIRTEVANHDGIDFLYNPGVQEINMFTATHEISSVSIPQDPNFKFDNPALQRVVMALISALTEKR